MAGMYGRRLPVRGTCELNMIVHGSSSSSGSNSTFAPYSYVCLTATESNRHPQHFQTEEVAGCSARTKTTCLRKGRVNRLVGPSRNIMRRKTARTSSYPVLYVLCHPLAISTNRAVIARVSTIYGNAYSTVYSEYFATVP